jgi:hypothetical protein
VGLVGPISRDKWGSWDGFARVRCRCGQRGADVTGVATAADSAGISVIIRTWRLF